MAQNIYQRLAAVMGEVDYIQKDKKQGMRYSIVSHDVVTAKVRPLLLKHGIVYPVSVLEHWQDGNMTGAKVEVAFVNIDDPSDRIVVNAFGHGIDDQDKGPGKAVSYAVKMALLKTLGLETGDDPDLDQDAKKRGQPTPPADPPPAAPKRDLKKELAFAVKKWSGVERADVPSAIAALAKACQVKDKNKATDLELITMLGFVEKHKGEKFTEACK